ncbi:uncharacterized protein LOC100884003 [Megachile rotundata]|uniref:uncharacterized protein LOC100884003 n=1 Tax=Megachile rotundata TaxID=143995 RepID=UPI000258E4D4|nr:PREDICTED: uncharacterized protein LOC100884003 [Megachile rotundata]
MADDINMTIYRKKMKVHVSKTLSIVKGWEYLGTIAAENICGPEYSHVPYLVDTYAYQFGSIFVQETSDVQCFCTAPQLKILGPIQDFLNPGKTDRRWLDKELPAIKTTGDHVNYKVVLENSKHSMRFRAYDAFFLEKPPDMSVEGDVTIDRSIHDELSHTDWFGLITGVFMADTTDIYLVRHHRERTFFIGDKQHTAFFKYIICKMDHKGTVLETASAKIECKWLPIEDRDLNSLPITKFVSQASKVKPASRSFKKCSL